MKTQDHLQQSIELRTALGAPLNSNESCNLRSHTAIILEEEKETADGHIDSIVTISGLHNDTDDTNIKLACLNRIEQHRRALAICGYSEEVIADKVQAANLSKRCSSMDIAKQTKAHYHKQGVDTYIRDMPDGSFMVFSACDQTDKSGKFIANNKFLKSIEWSEPDYSNPEEWIEDEFLSVLEY